MNSIIPIICGTLLTAMVGAGFSHYWSVQSLASMVPRAQQDAVVVQQAFPSIQKPAQKISQPIPDKIKTPPAIANTPSEKEFFNELLTELKQLRNENRDLRDLMGETNRDVMKLAFRVDTHSESFRPLPTSEERDDTTFHMPDDNGLPGVLPPRATPVQRLGD